jgi:hypothetical protein
MWAGSPSYHPAAADLGPAIHLAALGHGRCCVVLSLHTLAHDRDAALVQMVIIRSSKAVRSRSRFGVSVAMS